MSQLPDWPPIHAVKVSVAPVDAAHRAVEDAAAALTTADAPATQAALARLIDATASLVEWAHDVNRGLAVQRGITVTERPEAHGRPATATTPETQ
jgi:hypothetical protein